MARRVPGIRLRMEEAALELFEARGIANTTAAQVAAAAGTTERTFFRHFRNKLDAAFGDESRLRDTAGDAVTAAPEGTSAFGAVVAGMDAIAREFDGHRDGLVRRARVVAANPELQEREMSRGAQWAGAIAGALTGRGVDRRRAVLLAGVGLSLFRAAYEQWIDDADSNLTDVREGPRSNRTRRRCRAVPDRGGRHRLPDGLPPVLGTPVRVSRETVSRRASAARWCSRSRPHDSPGSLLGPEVRFFCFCAVFHSRGICVTVCE